MKTPQEDMQKNDDEHMNAFKAAGQNFNTFNVKEGGHSPFNYQSVNWVQGGLTSRPYNQARRVGFLS